MNWRDVFKTAGGGYDVNRVIGFIGGLAYIVGAHAFVAWNLAHGRPFDLQTYCLAFPFGLAAVSGGTAGAVAIKDHFTSKDKA